MAYVNAAERHEQIVAAAIRVLSEVGVPALAGGYMALPIAGALDGLLPLPSTPGGNIHWAGTETASDHAGHIEGAIESGLRVAQDVAQALSVQAH